MKALFIFFAVSLSLYVHAQPFLIEEEFNAGTAPTGWTFTSIGNTSSASNCGKSTKALVFNATADQIVSPTWSSGDQITFFMMCSSTPNATDNMLVEGYNGSAWTTLVNAKPHTTGKIVVVNISTTITKARITCTMGNAGNVYVDDFTVRQSGSCTGTQPYITSVNIDACSSGCEGRDEFFTFKTGSSALNIADIEFSYPDANSSSMTWCGTSANNPCDNYIATNASAVTALNTAAGCNIFTSPTGPIPAGANVMVFNGNPQQTPTSFTGLCASGITYYALFANNPSDCNGRFGNYNSGCNDCYRGFFLRDRSTGCSDTTSYSEAASGLNHGDGSSIIISSKNAAPVYSPSSGSACNFSVLPVLVTSFYAVTDQTGVTLIWDALDDMTLKNYTIDKSVNGIDFLTLGELPAHRSDGKNTYQMKDPDFSQGMYYRLRSKDVDDNDVNWNTLFVAGPLPAEPVITQDEQYVFVRTAFSEKSQSLVNLYNSTGALLYSGSFSGNSCMMPKGSVKNQLCFLVLEHEGKTFTRRFFAE